MITSFITTIAKSTIEKILTIIISTIVIIVNTVVSIIISTIVAISATKELSLSVDRLAFIASSFLVTNIFNMYFNTEEDR